MPLYIASCIAYWIANWIAYWIAHGIAYWISVKTLKGVNVLHVQPIHWLNHPEEFDNWGRDADVLQHLLRVVELFRVVESGWMVE